MKPKLVRLLSILLFSLLTWTHTGGVWATGGSAPRPHNNAVVIGGIDPCHGLPMHGGPRYAAGTVTVLRGWALLKHPTHGVRTWNFPTKIVGKVHVAKNSTYRFTLAPGHYVLRAQYPPPANVSPFVQFTARQGTTLHVDIPNVCM
jgi:hypothetical protein